MESCALSCEARCTTARRNSNMPPPPSSSPSPPPPPPPSAALPSASPAAGAWRPPWGGCAAPRLVRPATLNTSSPRSSRDMTPRRRACGRRQNEQHPQQDTGGVMAQRETGWPKHTTNQDQRMEQHTYMFHEHASQLLEHDQLVDYARVLSTCEAADRGMWSTTCTSHTSHASDTHSTPRTGR